MCTRLTSHAEGLAQRTFIFIFLPVYGVYLITLYTSKWVQAVTLLTCIRQVLTSNLGPTSGRPQICYGFPQYLVYATTAFFQVLCIHRLYHHLTHCSLDIPSVVKITYASNNPVCGVSWLYSVSPGKCRNNSLCCLLVLLSVSRQCRNNTLTEVFVGFTQYLHANVKIL